MTKKEIVYDYIQSMLGLPYRFGGSNPMAGFDCSGLVIELSAAIGKPPPHDMTAQQLYDFYLPDSRISVITFGSLAFYGKSRYEITHVAFCLSDELIVEAGSGTHETKSVDVAMRQNAFIRIRPISKRKDIVSCFLPNWSPDW